MLVHLKGDFMPSDLGFYVIAFYAAFWAFILIGGILELLSERRGH